MKTTRPTKEQMANRVKLDKAMADIADEYRKRGGTVPKSRDLLVEALNRLLERGVLTKR